MKIGAGTAIVVLRAGAQKGGARLRFLGGLGRGGHLMDIKARIVRAIGLS